MPGRIRHSEMRPSGHWLELVPHGELHHARNAQRIRISAEDSRREVEVKRSLSCIETWSVGHVERFPRELEVLLLGNLPGLVQAVVEFEVARSAKIVTLSRLSGIREAERANGLGGILEHVGVARRIPEGAYLPCGASLH